MKVILYFRVFRALVQGYVRKMYATNSSEIDKTFYQIAYHSQGNPIARAPCGTHYGKSWESVATVASWANQGGPIKLLKNNVQMHEMTRSTWPTVVLYSLKPSA